MTGCTMNYSSSLLYCNKGGLQQRNIIVIAQINNTKDEVVSFLKNKIESSDDTKITYKNIIENFFLNTENTSKLPKIRTAYKKDTK